MKLSFDGIATLEFLNCGPSPVVTLPSRVFLNRDSEGRDMATTEHLRRAAPRQPAGWFGFYRFDNVEREPWRCCRIIDLSPLGAGLELFATSPGECLDGPVTVSCELRGNTRNVVLGDDENSARVGVEFSDPSEAAKEYLRSISGVRSHW